ncbi:VTT domain-containing protein [Ramlibacter sp. AN1015]|uniref:DedA family protein n=1 Tax=Ramlibacter sp. AN1015 TaxID=3133428 RepID=UPI0030C596C4
MNFQQLLLEHGYWMLALGLLLEGETVLLLGAFGAQRGYFEPLAVFALGCAVAWSSDQTMFWLGRWKGVAVLARSRRLARAAVRARRLVRRWPHASVVGVRFAYGLRTAGPVLLGASGLPPLQFAVLSAVSAALWAGTFTTLGWVFSHALQQVLGYAAQAQLALLGLLVLAALAGWWFARRRKPRRA